MRILCLFLTCFALAFTAFVCDSASSAKYAAELIERAQGERSDSARALTLRRASSVLSSAWSRPLDWHAGAMELRSGAESLMAATPHDPILEASARDAVRGLQASPAQPLAWLRLASLARSGVANSVCVERVCLDRSWATGPILGVEDACLRLELELSRGARFSRTDEAIRNFMAARPNARQIGRCLAFLPPEQRFSLMLRGRGTALEKSERANWREN